MLAFQTPRRPGFDHFVTLRRALPVVLPLLVVGALSRHRPSAAPAPTMADAAAALDGIPAGINALGARLARALAPSADAAAADAGGAFLSPYGVARALALLLPGAEPGSASHRELLSAALGVPAGALDGAPADAVAGALRRLGDAVAPAGGAGGADAPEVADACSVWVGRGFALQPGYAAAVADGFGATAAPLRGAGGVNAWVKAATRGHIPGIIDDATAAQAALVLVNALYFAGKWQAGFDAAATRPARFRLMGGGEVPDAAMMELAHKSPADGSRVARFTAPLGGGSGGGVECVAVRLAYRGGAYSAVAAMPAAEPEPGGGALRAAGGGSYAAALAACGAAVADGLAAGGGGGGGLPWARVGAPRGGVAALRLHLPRFVVDAEASLGAALRAAGLSAPFAGGDFTRLAADANGAAVGDLAVSDVLHRVHAEVDEAGTVAAAATAVVMLRSAAPLGPRTEVVARFDRPFYFAVVHEASGVALFAGEVRRPASMPPAKG